MLHPRELFDSTKRERTALNANALQVRTVLGNLGEKVGLRVSVENDVGERDLAERRAIHEESKELNGRRVATNFLNYSKKFKFSLFDSKLSNFLILNSIRKFLNFFICTKNRKNN